MYAEEKSSSVKSEDTGFYIMLLGNVTSLILNCYSVSFLLFPRSPFSLTPHFILSFPFISTFHVHSRWLVWILVLSALPISPYAVAVRLKPTVHASPHINAARELAAVHLMRRQQLSPKIFWDFSLSDVSAMLVRSNWISGIVTFADKPSLRTSTLFSQGLLHPWHTLLSYYDQIPHFYSLT